MEQPHCLTRRVGVGTLTLITSLLRSHSGLLATTTTRRYHKKGIHSTHLVSKRAEDFWDATTVSVSELCFLTRVPFRCCLWCSHFQAFYPFTKLAPNPVTDINSGYWLVTYQSRHSLAALPWYHTALSTDGSSFGDSH